MAQDFDYPDIRRLELDDTEIVELSDRALDTEPFQVLLECKTAFRVPAKWQEGRCHYCGMRFKSMVKYQARIKSVS